MKITKVKSKAHWGKGVMCQCNHPDPLICHECKESTGGRVCICHKDFKRPKTQRSSE